MKLQPRCTAEAADLSEVYSALQGEGTRVGERQVFVRFLECHIRCPYCDTPDQDPRVVVPRLEQTPGERDWREVTNPVAAADLLAAIRRLQTHPGLHRAVSFTGGEPLWYHPMIAAVAPPLRAEGWQIYVETDGLLADELAAVAPHVDAIAMDVKLHWARHGFLDREATLRTLAVALTARAATGAELLLKIVVPAGLAREPFLEVVGALADATASAATSGAQPPLILQPVTPYGPVTAGPEPGELLALHGAASALYPACRVVPQVHKLIGQR